VVRFQDGDVDGGAANDAAMMKVTLALPERAWTGWR
jgi:hypothetical protein